MKFFIGLAILCIGCFSLGDAATSLICGGSSSSKNIALVNPSLPPKECVYTIAAYSTSVSQLRIDFTMTLAQPSLPSSANGFSIPECVNDYLLIGDLKLCGVEKSQHIYVPFNRTAGVKSIDIRIVTSTRVGGSQLPQVSWNLQVNQLEGTNAKDSFFVAPPGCDQYFPYAEGIVQSFNYNNGRGLYPYNLNYAICFRRTANTVGLIITGLDFNIGEDGPDKSIFAQIDSNCYPQVETTGRGEDYLMIPQATMLQNDVRANYFCGHSLYGQSILSTNPGPLLMIFNSDGKYQEGVSAQGFSLQYKVLSG